MATGGLNDIEPAAYTTAGCEPGNGDSAIDRMLLASVAISLKRIADALSNDGGVRGDVLYWLEIIASAANAGRS